MATSPTGDEINEAAEKARRAAEGVTVAARDVAAAALSIKPDRLSKFNTAVTLAAAIATTVFGVFLKSGEVRLQGIEEKTKAVEERIKQLDEREKTEDASYKFAHEFLDNIKSGDPQHADPRSSRLAIAALDIIAQASSSAKGDSKVDARAALPIHMALLLGDAGSIAAMDADWKYHARWFGFAQADNGDSTRVTAIQALGALCRTAVHEHNLERVQSCSEEIDSLLKLIDGTRSAEALISKNEALTVKTTLGNFLRAPENHFELSLLASGAAAPSEARRKAVLDLFEDAAQKLQTNRLSIVVAEKQSDPAASSGPADEAQKVRLDRILDESKNALTQTGAALAQLTAKPGELDPVAVGPEKADPRIAKLIGQLTSDDAAVRRKARSDLAFFRQDAVKPMLAAVAGKENAPDETAARLRLGVATALSQMVQPINLEAAQATQVVALIGAADAETRQASAEFLMNLENSATIQHVYDAIAVRLKGRVDPAKEKDGNAIKNAASILGTWPRALSDDILATDGTPMREYARLTLEGLKNDLQRENAKGWADTISMIEDLLQRATAARRKAAKY